jgi:hypothetical protein
MQGAAVTYPYVVNNLVSITNSTQGLNVYYYFFNWEIEKTSTVCTSVLVPVLADVVTGINNVSNHENIQLFPNPASEKITITSGNTINSNVLVNIVDVAGRVAQTASFNNLTANGQQTIDISKLAKGVYFVKINSSNSEMVEKLVVR